MPSQNTSVHRPSAAAFPKRPTNKLRTRSNPPIECDTGEWQWRTASPIYRRKVKRSVELIKRYRQLTVGCSYLDRPSRDAIHRLLDVATFDSSRQG